MMLPVGAIVKDTRGVFFMIEIGGKRQFPDARTLSALSLRMGAARAPTVTDTILNSFPTAAPFASLEAFVAEYPGVEIEVEHAITAILPAAGIKDISERTAFVVEASMNLFNLAMRQENAGRDTAEGVQAGLKDLFLKDFGEKDEGVKEQFEKEEGQKEQFEKEQGQKEVGQKEQGEKEFGEKDFGKEAGQKEEGEKESKDIGDKEAGDKEQGDKDQNKEFGEKEDGKEDGEKESGQKETGEKDEGDKDHLSKEDGDKEQFEKEDDEKEQGETEQGGGDGNGNGKGPIELEDPKDLGQLHAMEPVSVKNEWDKFVA